MLYESLYVLLGFQTKNEATSSAKKGIKRKIVGYDDIDYRVLVDNKIVVSQNVRIINENSNRIIYLEEESDTKNREAHEPVLDVK